MALMKKKTKTKKDEKQVEKEAAKASVSAIEVEKRTTDITEGELLMRRHGESLSAWKTRIKAIVQAPKVAPKSKTTKKV